MNRLFVPLLPFAPVKFGDPLELKIHFALTLHFGFELASARRTGRKFLFDQLRFFGAPCFRRSSNVASTFLRIGYLKKLQAALSFFCSTSSINRSENIMCTWG